MPLRLLGMHGVQGVECSNHSVPTKILQRIQSLSGDWIFLCLRFLPLIEIYPTFCATEMLIRFRGLLSTSEFVTEVCSGPFTSMR